MSGCAVGAHNCTSVVISPYVIMRSVMQRALEWAVAFKGKETYSSSTQQNLHKKMEFDKVVKKHTCPSYM